MLGLLIELNRIWNTPFFRDFSPAFYYPLLYFLDYALMISRACVLVFATSVNQGSSILLVCSFTILHKSSHQLISQKTFPNLVSQRTPVYAISSDSYYGVSAFDLPLQLFMLL